MTQLRYEVQVGDGDGELELLHKLIAIDALYHKVHKGHSILVKELLEDTCLLNIDPASAVPSKVEHSLPHAAEAVTK